jgi:hypothetical protein
VIVPSFQLVNIDDCYRKIIAGEQNIKMIAQYRLDQEIQKKKD